MDAKTQTSLKTVGFPSLLHFFRLALAHYISTPKHLVKLFLQQSWSKLNSLHLIHDSAYYGDYLSSDLTFSSLCSLIKLTDFEKNIPPCIAQSPFEPYCAFLLFHKRYLVCFMKGRLISFPLLQLQPHLSTVFDAAATMHLKLSYPPGSQGPTLGPIPEKIHLEYVIDFSLGLWGFRGHLRVLAFLNK